jgi:hypothetical protein
MKVLITCHPPRAGDRSRRAALRTMNGLCMVLRRQCVRVERTYLLPWDHTDSNVGMCCSSSSDVGEHDPRRFSERRAAAGGHPLIAEVNSSSN